MRRGIPRSRSPQRRQTDVRLDEYSPRVGDVLAKLPAGFPLGVKVAPAVPWDELDRYDCEVEFVSLGGELKEGCLWFGPLGRQRRTATVLPAGVTLAAEEPSEREECVEPLAYLYDPDPAVTRAGLVTNLARQIGARQIDPRIAFLTADLAVATPFAKCYRILESLPFHAKRLKDCLRAQDVGHATIVKRGSAVDANALQKSLALKGTRTATVILTMVGDQPLAIVAES
jgi:THUMP domain-like